MNNKPIYVTFGEKKIEEVLSSLQSFVVTEFPHVVRFKVSKNLGERKRTVQQKLDEIHNFKFSLH